MERFFASLTGAIVRGRWILLALVAGASVFLARQLPRLEFDNSNEQWLVEGDRSLELIRRFNDLFGNDDFVYILFESEDFFDAERIQRFRALAEDLEARVPYVLDVTWLGNAEAVEGRGDSIHVEALMETPPETAAELERARRRALAEPSYVDDLISRDSRTAGLLLEMDSYPEDRVDPRKDVAPAVRAVLADPRHADLGVVAVGGPLLDHDLDVLSIEESRRLGLLCIGVQMAILLWVGRGPRGVAVPLAVVVLGIVWTFGVIALSGYELNFSVIMVPVLLICVGIGDSMHLIAEWNEQCRRGRRRREAMRRSMALVGWPCVLTSATTGIGFLSFLAADIRPFREMGIYAATGVGVALLLSFLLVPILYSWGRSTGGGGRATRRARDDVFDRLLRATARLVTARPRAVVAAFAALAAGSAVGLLRVEIETNPIRMFSEGVPIREAFEYVDARMGGSMSVEVLLDTQRRDGVLDPGFLEDMERFDRFLREHELTTKTASVLDVFRQMGRAFHENRAEFYRIPETREAASQYLLVYEMSGGEDKGKLVPFENDVARLTVRTRSLGTSQVGRLFREAEAFAAEELGEPVRVEFTGMMAWAQALMELVARGQRQSFTAAFLSITLLMTLVLRSLRLGLLSMIPNVFPVLITLGMLGWSGTPIDVMLMGFSALIIGVAVDDTIHFFVRYRREFGRLGGYASALEATLVSVGRPILFTTLTLSLGFLVLAASDMIGLVHFGALSAFAFTWALMADFLFAPALLLWLQPLGPERPTPPSGAAGPP